jgi:hypothetical protein
MRLRAELRRRWRSWLALALIVGAFAGAVEAAAAGARRTDAAYPSLLAWSKAPDLLAASDPGQPVFGSIPQSALAGLPQVTGDAFLAEYSVARPSDVALLAPESRKVPAAFWRRKMLAGRLPDPRRADEANVSFTLAQAHHLQVGDAFRIEVFTSGAKPRPVPFTFRIVGIDAAPAEFPPQTGDGNRFPVGDTGLLRPAPLRAHDLPGGRAAAPAWRRGHPARTARDRAPDSRQAAADVSTRHPVGQHRALHPPAGRRPLAARTAAWRHRRARRRPVAGAPELA